MQRELSLIGTIKSPERIPAHLVSLCRSSGEAVLLAIRYGKKSQRQVASAVGIEPSQLARVICGNAHMPADKARSFAYVVGNWGWQQWVAFDCGMDMVPRTESLEEKLARLESENADLRSAAA